MFCAIAKFLILPETCWLCAQVANLEAAWLTNASVLCRPPGGVPGEVGVIGVVCYSGEAQCQNRSATIAPLPNKKMVRVLINCPKIGITNCPQKHNSPRPRTKP